MATFTKFAEYFSPSMSISVQPSAEGARSPDPTGVCSISSQLRSEPGHASRIFRVSKASDPLTDASSNALLNWYSSIKLNKYGADFQYSVMSGCSSAAAIFAQPRLARGSEPPWSISSSLCRKQPVQQCPLLVSEQLLQPSLPQRLVGADRDAIAPAANLLHGEAMTGGRLAHLNLELGSRRDRVGPASVLQRRDAKRCGLVDRFSDDLN